MPLLVGPAQIVLGVQGGIGNQLFEWAFAQALKHDGHEVVFDDIRCRGDRPMMLGTLISSEDRLARPTAFLLLAAARLGLLRESSRPIPMVRQRQSGFDPSVVPRLRGRAYVLGYFQSPRYFDSVAEIVRTEATAHLRSMLTDRGSALVRELEADPQSVALHVRRGDYISDPSAAVRHGVLDGDYYRRARAYLEAQGPRRLVWFGDDREWIRQNLARDGDTICTPDLTTADGGEIALMAACSARVIANSSFSWWAGWLGGPSTAEHTVVAPTTWFADGHSDGSDLIPSGWMRM